MIPLCVRCLQWHLTENTTDISDAEIIFQVRESSGRDYEARAVAYSIFTQGDDWGDLIYMMRDAVLCHFDDGEAPRGIRAVGETDSLILSGIFLCLPEFEKQSA